MKMLEICLRYAARLHVGSMNLRVLSEIRCKGTAFSRHTQYFVPQVSPFVPQLVLLSIERYICPYNNLLPYYKKRLKVTLIEFVNVHVSRKSHSFGEPNSAQISSAIWFMATHSARVTWRFCASYSHGERMSTRPSATASNKLSPGL